MISATAKHLFRTPIRASSVRNGKRFSQSTSGAASEIKAADSAITPTVPIGMSLAAMCAGVTTVGATCAGIEQLTSPECPEFDARGTRFDQGTFMGRFAERLLACDPTLLVYSSGNHDFSWTKSIF